jgi:murein L,D-transpeptidase YcbB/YkuD
VRVEEPLTLSRLLLSPQDWDQDRLNQAVATHARQVIPLQEPVPVYLVYWTAWAEPNGDVHFRDDIYGRDQTLREALAAGASPRTTCRSARLHPTYLGDYHPRGRRGFF